MNADLVGCATVSYLSLSAMGSEYHVPHKSRTPACSSKLPGRRFALIVMSWRNTGGTGTVSNVRRAPMYWIPLASENRFLNRGTEKRNLPIWPGELASVTFCEESRARCTAKLAA